jgi:hypothetical protein
VIDEFTDGGLVKEEETHPDKPKKSQCITFRLDSQTIDELQREFFLVVYSRALLGL